MSKTDSKISPAPATTELRTASTEKTFSRVRMLGGSLDPSKCQYGALSDDEIRNQYLPLCLNHRSTTRVRTNPTAVIEQPTIKRGLSISAPISDMYAIDPSMLTYLGRPWTSQVMSIASNVASHTEAVRMGIHT